MKDLPMFLKLHKYKKVKFKILKTQHLIIKAKVNGISGNFILDTGASNTCIGFDYIEKYSLKSKKHNVTAASASSTSMLTKFSEDNSLQLGSWKQLSSDFILFDLSSVNVALSIQKIKPIDGVIGGDVLVKGNAIIDYPNQYLYLK